MYTGRCLCGAIEFSIEGELAPIQICYCKQCQRAQGTALATNIPVSVSVFRFLQGESSLSGYESSPGKRRYFCSHCGSPIYSRRDSLPDVLRVRAGLLSGPIATQPTVQFFTADKPNWWLIFDDLPQHAAGLPNDHDTQR